MRYLQNNDTANRPKTGPSFRSILSVNAGMVYAFFLGGVAWLVWPQNKEWWQLGILSILFGAVAISLAIRSIIEIWRIVLRDREVDKFSKSRRAPQSDKMASDSQMRDKGMFE